MQDIIYYLYQNLQIHDMKRISALIQKQAPDVFYRNSSRPATLLKKRLWHRYFPVNFVIFLRIPFLQNTSGRLLLLKFWNKGNTAKFSIIFSKFLKKICNSFMYIYVFIFSTFYVVLF